MEPEARSPEPSRRWKPALATLAIGLGLLGVAEAVARRISPEPPPQPWLPHPFVGAVRPANYSVEKRDIDTGELFRYEVDAFGFRGRSLKTLEKPVGTYRIFFAGASTTENGDLPEEATFPGIVEARLNELFKGRPRVEVANAGVPGGTSAQTLAQVSQRILPFDPDLVCVLDPSTNDLSDSLRSDWDPAGFYLAESHAPRFRDWLVGRSRLVALFDARFSTAEPDARAMFAKRAKARQSRPVLEPSFDVCRGLPLFRAHERQLVRLCKSEGVSCLLMTVATLLKPQLTPEEDARVCNTLVRGTDYNFRPATFLAAVEKFNESVRATAREEGALVVDAANAVPRDLEHFADDFHMTRKGNAAVAEAIVSEITRGGALPPRPARVKQP